MIEQIISIPLSKLQKGTITETGTYENNNAHIRTESASNYAVQGNQAFVRGELDFVALKLKPVSGSFEGTTDLRYNIANYYDTYWTYTENVNYTLQYYWVFGYDDDDVLRYAGYFAVRTPIPNGNKSTDTIYAESRLHRQSDGYLDRDILKYCAEIDIEGDSITYYNSGKSGETTTTTVMAFIAGSYIGNNFRVTKSLKGVRESEEVKPDVALLGFIGINRGTPLLYSERWFTGSDEVVFSPDVPLNSFAVVLKIDGVENPTVDSIIKRDIKLQAEAWYLDRDDKLDNIDIIESIEGDIFTPPYPATMWYYDQWWSRLNMLLLPEPLIVGIYTADRPKQISVYDINEPQSGFNHNGLAILMPIECISDKEEAGRWDLTLVHPIDDYNKWTYIVGQNVLKVNGQLFRIDETEIYLDAEQSYITAHAKHITYDLYDRFVDEVTVESVSGGMYIEKVIQRSQEILPTHQPEPNEYIFDVSSNIEGPVTAKVQDQTVIGAIFGDDNSLASRYGGQIYRDNFHISINTTLEGAPQSPAFKLRYGTDLTKLSYKIDFSQWVTELICKDNLGNLWAVSYTGSTWIIHHQKTRIIHFTYDPETPDAMGCLMRDGFAYWQTVSTPTISIEVSVAALKNDPKYKDFVDLQNLDVGYTGNVYIEQYNIDVNMKIVSIRRDELTGEALQVVLGTSRGSFIRSPVMSQTIVANGTALGKQELEMQAMQKEIVNLNIKQMRFWRGLSSFKWADAKKYTWGEIISGHKY